MKVFVFFVQACSLFHTCCSWCCVASPCSSWRPLWGSTPAWEGSAPGGLFAHYSEVILCCFCLFLIEKYLGKVYLRFYFSFYPPPLHEWLHMCCVWWRHLHCNIFVSIGIASLGNVLQSVTVLQGLFLFAFPTFLSPKRFPSTKLSGKMSSIKGASISSFCGVTAI